MQLSVRHRASQRRSLRRSRAFGDFESPTVLGAGQPFVQFRPASAARRVAHSDGDRLLLPHQHHQPLAERDPGVEQVPLQHRVMLGQPLTVGRRLPAIGIGRWFKDRRPGMGAPVRDVVRVSHQLPPFPFPVTALRSCSHPRSSIRCRHREKWRFAMSGNSGPGRIVPIDHPLTHDRATHAIIILTQQGEVS